jgi:serine palmitoyltransferase
MGNINYLSQNVTILTFFVESIFFIESHIQGYAPLTRDFEDFFTRRMYYRIRDCWNRPICSVPGDKVTLIDRESPDCNEHFFHSGGSTECINMASYNYLGYAQNTGPCVEATIDALKRHGQSTCSPRRDLGTGNLHRKLEKQISSFLGKEDAMVLGMGFATNSTVLPLLGGKDTLVISDSLNHASIVTGSRNSGSKIRVFPHQNFSHLEKLLRRSISEGQPRTHRPWRNIIVLVEGVYSMEGEVCNIPQLLELKKKYKFLIYLDEAHSIGALGKSGRGVCEHCGVDTKEIDIMMGTFTKSFGSVGGYIAASKEIITYLKKTTWGSTYACSMSLPTVSMALASFEHLRMPEGKERILRLRENSIYFRQGLIDLGFEVLGDRGSPVIPVLMYHPCKIACVSHLCLERGVAAVVVGFPATPLLECRVRFCISAAHTKEELDRTLAVMSDVGDRTWLKYMAY